MQIAATTTNGNTVSITASAAGVHVIANHPKLGELRGLVHGYRGDLGGVSVDLGVGRCDVIVSRHDLDALHAEAGRLARAARTPREIALAAIATAEDNLLAAQRADYHDPERIVKARAALDAARDHLRTL